MALLTEPQILKHRTATRHPSCGGLYLVCGLQPSADGNSPSTPGDRTPLPLVEPRSTTDNLGSWLSHPMRLELAVVGWLPAVASAVVVGPWAEHHGALAADRQRSLPQVKAEQYKQRSHGCFAGSSASESLVQGAFNHQLVAKSGTFAHFGDGLV